MLNPLRPFVQIFRSRTRRRMGAFFLLAILLSIIFDFVDGIDDSDLTVFWRAVGGGGGFLFLGVNLLRFLPDDPIYRWHYRGMGILLVLGGSLFLISGLTSIWLR